MQTTGHSNGVVERFFESIKYEHLYRHEVPNAIELAREVDAFRSVYNLARLHESLGFINPMQAYLTPPGQPFPKLP